MPEPRFIPLAELHEDPANVRKHGDRNKASVRASILEFGQVETLVVQRGTGRVLGGNCRLGELRALGREGAWCMEVDVEGIDATRLALALNRTAELAEWDAEGLSQVLRSLSEEGGSAADLGWDGSELSALLDPVGVDDVKWKEFDENIGNNAPKGKPVKCPHCGGTFDA